MANPKTMVYVDGFNLYFGAIKGTNCKWLDILSLSHRLLPNNDILGIKYFTAIVSGKDDPGSPIRQNIYVRALKASGVQVFLGLFSYTDVWRRATIPKVQNPKEQHQLYSASPISVQVRDAKEKGSDVNLASHLITDAWLDAYEAAVVVSNDSDLATAIQLVRQHKQKIVGIINPQRTCELASELRPLADFKLKVRLADLQACQLPTPIVGKNGKQIAKPPEWA